MKSLNTTFHMWQLVFFLLCIIGATFGTEVKPGDEKAKLKKLIEEDEPANTELPRMERFASDTSSHGLPMFVRVLAARQIAFSTKNLVYLRKISENNDSIFESMRKCDRELKEFIRALKSLNIKIGMFQTEVKRLVDEEKLTMQKIELLRPLISSLFLYPLASSKKPDASSSHAIQNASTEIIAIKRYLAADDLGDMLTESMGCWARDCIIHGKSIPYIEDTMLYSKDIMRGILEALYCEFQLCHAFIRELAVMVREGTLPYPNAELEIKTRVECFIRCAVFMVSHASLTMQESNSILLEFKAYQLLIYKAFNEFRSSGILTVRRDSYAAVKAKIQGLSVTRGLVNHLVGRIAFPGQTGRTDCISDALVEFDFESTDIPFITKNDEENYMKRVSERAKSMLSSDREVASTEELAIFLDYCKNSISVEQFSEMHSHLKDSQQNFLKHLVTVPSTYKDYLEFYERQAKSTSPTRHENVATLTNLVQKFKAMWELMVLLGMKSMREFKDTAIKLISIDAARRFKNGHDDYSNLLKYLFDARLECLRMKKQLYADMKIPSMEDGFEGMAGIVDNFVGIMPQMVTTTTSKYNKATLFAQLNRMAFGLPVVFDAILERLEDDLKNDVRGPWLVTWFRGELTNMAQAIGCEVMDGHDRLNWGMLAKNEWMQRLSNIQVQSQSYFQTLLTSFKSKIAGSLNAAAERKMASTLTKTFMLWLDAVLRTWSDERLVFSIAKCDRLPKANSMAVRKATSMKEESMKKAVLAAHKYWLHCYATHKEWSLKPSALCDIVFAVYDAGICKEMALL